MKRSDKKKRTRQALINTTLDLLYKKGYCETGITEILSIVGMTKGALYYHFKSKHELVLETIKSCLEALIVDSWTTVELSDTPILSLIEQCQIYESMFTDKECYLEVKHGSPLGNFTLDMSDTDVEISLYLKSVYSRWQNLLEKALTKAKTLQITKTDFNAKRQAMYIVSTIEGIIGSAKAKNDVRSMHDGFEILTKHIKAL